MAAAVATAPPTADEASPSSIDDLRSALRESLQQRGVLGRVRAQLRSEIFHTIDAGADAPPPRADPATSTLVVEELVREYLAFAGYGHALSVFEAESRSAERGASITRAQIQHELVLHIPDLAHRAAQALPRRAVGVCGCDEAGCEE